MSVSFMDRYFSADAAAKAATVRTPEPAPRRGTSMDDAVSADLMSRNRDQTLVGFIYGHEARMTEAENYYRAGQDDKGDAIIDRENEMIEANRAGIHRLGMSRDGNNPEANGIYETARKMGRQDYMSRKIRRAADGDDGPEYTIGQIHSKQADDIKSAGIEGYGFRKSTCDGYFGRSIFETDYEGADLASFKDMVKACNRVFVDPEVKLGSPSVSSDLRQQRISGADFVNKNAKRLFDTFGSDGAQDFVRTVVSRSKGAGGMDKVMDSLLGMYEARKAKGLDVSGRDAADGFFDAVTSVNGPGMTDSEYRNAAMGAVEAVKASSQDFDFGDPVARRAFGLGVSILSRAYADGYNLLKLGDDRGKDVRKYLGNFIATVNETGEIPQNNPLSRLYSLHNRLRQVVTPDGSPLQEPEPTGSTAAYRQPAVTGAGNVAKGFMAALEREMAVAYFSDLSDQEAFDKVRFDIDGAARRVNARVARDMGVDENTARILTTRMFSYIGDTRSARGPVNIEGMMNDLALTNPVAKAWYNANVSDRRRYAREEAETAEFLTSPLGGGLTPAQASARIATLRMDADAALRRGEDPRQTVWGKETGTGYYVVPTGNYFSFSQKGGVKKVSGNAAKTAYGTVPEFATVRGDFDKAEFSYRGVDVKPGSYSADRTGFIRMQREMAAERDSAMKTLRSWGGRVKGEASDDDSYRLGD